VKTSGRLAVWHLNSGFLFAVKIMNTDSRRDGKGLSTRHLLLIFLAGVAVCGVFFSLGFLVGYNERSARVSPATERVTTSGTIPPTVNPPLETVPIGTNNGTRSASSTPPSLANRNPVSTSSSATQPKPETAARVVPPAASPALSGRPDVAPETAGPTSAETQTGESAFIVQVTAMRAKQDAEAVVRVLRGRGYHALLVAPQHAHAKDSLYRVQVGPFASRESAEKTLAKLKHEGYKPFIRH
jgi:cell division septation protein DedD